MLIFNYSQHYIFTSARVSSHPPDLTVIPHLWNSSCIIYKIKKRNVVTLSWNNNSAMKYGLSRNDSVLWNLKFNSNIHFQTTSHRDLFVIYHLWWCTYVQAMYTGQPPSGEKTSKHCPIDVPFFFPRLALVRGQPQTACGGIRRYCRCHIDALQGPGGHVSVNIHYQNP